MEQPPVWQRCLSELEDELSSQQLNTWLRPLRAIVEPGLLRLYAPNRFVQDWVRERFSARIAEIAGREEGRKMAVVLEIGTPGPAEAVGASEDRKTHESAQLVVKRPVGGFVGRLNPEFTFESHVEGKSNQLARAAARQVGENPGRSYNPLFIYGGVGLGKTHLMHAAGHLMLERNPQARVVYVHSERFVADMVKALRHNTINEFKRYYRCSDALLIDDRHFFIGKEYS